MHPIVLRRPRVFYRFGQSEVSGHAEAPALDRAPVMNGTSCWRWPILSPSWVLDEVQIHQVPVLLGRGRRLFEVLPSRIELEIVRVIDTPEATHIRYRIRR